MSSFLGSLFYSCMVRLRTHRSFFNPMAQPVIFAASVSLITPYNATGPMAVNFVNKNIPGTTIRQLTNKSTLAPSTASPPVRETANWALIKAQVGM